MTTAAINSKFVHATAILLWSFPVTYILGLTALYNLTLSSCIAIVFSAYYIAHSLFSIYVGFLVHQLRPWAWHYFLVHCGLLVIEQFYIAFNFAEVNLEYISIIVAIAAILAFAWLVKFELRVPYFSPRIAWWEGDPRYKLIIPADIIAPDRKISGQILDLSASGCFIKTGSHLDVEDTVSVRFSLFDEDYTLKGMVVWVTDSTVTHPKGVGVRFRVEDRARNSSLRNKTKQLRQLNKEYQQKRKERKATELEKKIASYTSHNESKPDA